jgi:hypothetical protein
MKKIVVFCFFCLIFFGARSQVMLLEGKKYGSGKVVVLDNIVPIQIKFFTMQDDSLYFYNSMRKVLEVRSLDELKFVQYKTGTNLGKFAGIGFFASTVGVLITSFGWQSGEFKKLSAEQKRQNYKAIGLSTVAFGLIGSLIDKTETFYFGDKNKYSVVPDIGNQTYGLNLKIKL